MADVPIDRIPRGVNPPRNRPPCIDFLRVSPYQPSSVVLVSGKLIKTEVHYWCERTVPHTEPAASCAPCRDGWQRPKWYGFALVQIATGKLNIARITEKAAESCPLLLDETIDLRGKLLVLERIKKSPRGEMRATLKPGPNLVHLAPELDLWPILLNLWGIHPDFPPVERPKGERFPGRRKPAEDN